MLPAIHILFPWYINCINDFHVVYMMILTMLFSPSLFYMKSSDIGGKPDIAGGKLENMYGANLFLYPAYGTTNISMFANSSFTYPPPAKSITMSIHYTVAWFAKTDISVLTKSV